MRARVAITALCLATLAVAEARAQAQPDSPEVGAPRDAPLAPLEVTGRDPSDVVFPGGYRLSALGGSERVDVGGGEPLTLGQVLASVERHHPTLEAERQRVRAAEGERLAAEGGFDLNLTAQGWAAPVGYYDWARADVRLDQATPLWGASLYAGWRIGRGGDIPGYYGGYETLDLGEVRAGVSVPLWRDGPIDSRRARLWRAEHATDAQDASLRARMLRMRLEAAAAYWSWVAAGQKYRIASNLLDLAERRDQQIAARVRSGAIPPIESLENRRVILARRTSLVAARRGLERTAIRLSLYYRGDDGSPRVPQGPRVPDVIEIAERRRVDLRREVRAAWARRPELERYDALIERQRVSVDFAENQFAPRIDLTVGTSVDLGAGNGTTAVGSDQQASLSPPVVEGSVLVSLPLQFREARGGIERTRAELAAMRAEAQLARDSVATDVQDAHSALSAAWDRAELAREAAEVATAVAEAERRRFELGSTQLFIVNLREQAAAEARATLVDAEASLSVAQAAWAAATGRTSDRAAAR